MRVYLHGELRRGVAGVEARVRATRVRARVECACPAHAQPARARHEHARVQVAEHAHVTLLFNGIPPLLPTHRVSCVTRYATNWQWTVKPIESRGKAKTVWKLTSHYYLSVAFIRISYRKRHTVDNLNRKQYQNLVYSDCSVRCNRSAVCISAYAAIYINCNLPN
jgi:hypothetical protein